MLKRLNNEKGSTLALVLIVMAVLSVLGAAVLNVAVAETRFAVRAEDRLQAYYIARSGAQAVAEYMMSVPPADANKLLDRTSDPNYQIGGGSFVVTVSQSTELDSVSIVTITSVGEYRGATQTVKIRVSTSPGGDIFQHAIAARSTVTTANTAGSGIKISGSVVSKTVMPSLGTHGVATSTGVDATLVFPPIVLPEGEEYTPIPGYTYGDVFRGYTFGGTFPTGVTYVRVTSVSLMSSSQNIVVQGDRVVHMYVDGDVQIDKGAITIGDNAAFFMYVSGNRSINFKGSGATKNVMIYAPDSTVTWNNAQNNATFNGAIIADSVILHNQIEIEYNSTLRNLANISTANIGIIYNGYSFID